MSYVALDLASTAGAAVWYDGGAKPMLTTLKLRKPADADGDLARPLERLRAWLADVHAVEPIKILFFEAAILPNPKVNDQGRAMQVTRIETVATLCALTGMAEWFAYRIGAQCRQVEQQKWRKHFCGKGTGKTAELKQLAKDNARLRGWSVANDHEADAAGVLDFGLHCFGIETPWRDAHLFGGGMSAGAQQSEIRG